MQNPLLNIANLPEFSKVKPEHVSAAVDSLLVDGKKQLVELLAEQTQVNWDSLIKPMNSADNQLSRAWSVVSHMNAVVNTEAMREAYNANLSKLSEYHTELGQNQKLYEAIRHIRTQDKTLDAAQQQSLENSLLSFRLSGVALPEDKKQRFKIISQELSQLCSQFSDNVLDATQAWIMHITQEEQLAGLPDSAIAMAAQVAKQRDLSGWVFTLDFPSYLAVVTYANQRELREKIYHAYTTRASDQSEYPQFDNLAIMQKILKLRQEEADLLGYKNYAEISLASKMAESPEQVITFLEDLAHRSKPFAKQEMQTIIEYANQLGIEALAAWDIAYISEKIKQERFAFSDEDLKPYFPVERVIQGLFELVSQLYQVRFEAQEDGIDKWHQDVRFYRIYTADNQLLAEFYLDLYARQNKQGGAWMSDFCGRFQYDESLQTPVAFMTCNSAPPIGDQPALFTHDEVVTLFHEFGHGLHHMLTRVNYPEVAGINGVEWDAVELPSQFMENWCWERTVLDRVAAHWQTGERLPDALFNKMLAARHFQSAMGIMRQLEFALFDLHLHMQSDAQAHLYEIVQQVRDQVAVVKYPDYNRMPNSFTHIFAGGYAAGYYSYKWAEVLSADAFARFEEEGLFNEAVGLAFKREILEVGGSRPALQSFKAFRGREPRIDALLRHSGLTQTA